MMKLENNDETARRLEPCDTDEFFRGGIGESGDRRELCDAGEPPVAQAEEKRLHGWRAARFLKRHGLEIVLGGAAVALGCRCLYLRQENAALMLENLSKAIRIEELVALCEEKDCWFMALMSDALRHGSSFAGKCMQQRRALLDAA